MNSMVVRILFNLGTIGLTQRKPAMKVMKNILARPTLQGLAIGLAATALSSYIASATPYATSLTNNGNGSVSFRLNQTTTTNDTVWINQRRRHQ